ncbi:hypothetical protein BDV25DRAFT_163320 [Aspergillus avenaceus]|uniref:Clr5 domain-containing protein n=1 Tax=Aspergillus avenaceus TaxID=36643 RepID=A0A5N6TI29_ASPAV|nr:hypothetical protein BDV25DRAFT_163320 [Aspergillus avenaceus]
MKNTIPSDVWERKKALIAKLYKDEEWPLKQVIKQIRSDDFNPSETQLRSRLKKWRVTKPSRQTRKKSHDDQQDVNGDSSSHGTGSPKGETPVSPKTQLYPAQKQTPTILSSTDTDLYVADGAYIPHDLPTTGPFDGHHVWPRDRDSSVVMMPSSNAFEQSHTSLVDGVLLDSASRMAPAFHNASYAVATGPCITNPTTTTAAPINWAVPQWYPMQLEAGTQPPTMPYYTTAPLSPPIDQALQIVPPHPPHRVYSPPSPGCSFSHEQMFDLHETSKPSVRTMSVPYGPGTAGGHPSVEQKGRQQTPMEKKTSLPSKLHNQHAAGLVTPPSPFFPSGQPVLCAPAYQY